MFIATNNFKFPNFYPIGLYSSKEKAIIEEIESLSKDYYYQLFEIAIDQFFGYLDKKGVLKSGIGVLRHEHYIDIKTNESVDNLTSVKIIHIEKTLYEFRLDLFI